MNTIKRLPLGFPVLIMLIQLAFASGEAGFVQKIPLGLIEPDIPINDPLTLDKVVLGKKLFFDNRLSANRTLSCATCHDPNKGFSESRPVSLGLGRNARRRNSQSLLNVGYQATLDWDGRFRSLEDQLLGVFSPYGDMAMDIGQAVERIEKDRKYKKLFRKAFRMDPNVNTLSRALASYQRTLVSGDSRFDRFLFKKEMGALTSTEQRGFDLFIGKAGCITCHDIFHPKVNSLGGGTALFTDHRFHNLGVGYKNGVMSDVGRFEVTRNPSDWGAFRTPILRNVEITAPYMHDGSIRTLKEVIAFYDRGGIPNPNLSPGVHPLFLTNGEQESLVAFLKSLTDLNFLNALVRPAKSNQ